MAGSVVPHTPKCLPPSIFRRAIRAAAAFAPGAPVPEPPSASGDTGHRGGSPEWSGHCRRSVGCRSDRGSGGGRERADAAMGGHRRFRRFGGRVGRRGMAAAGLPRACRGRGRGRRACGGDRAARRRRDRGGVGAGRAARIGAWAASRDRRVGAPTAATAGTVARQPAARLRRGARRPGTAGRLGTRADRRAARQAADQGRRRDAAGAGLGAGRPDPVDPAVRRRHARRRHRALVRPPPGGPAPDHRRA